MRSHCFALGMLLIGGALLWHWRGGDAAGAPASPRSWLAREDEAAVLVLVVDGPAALDTLRAAIRPDRILAQTPQALALRGDLVVAASVEAASAPLNAAGWAGRPLRLLSLDRERAARLAGAGRPAPAPLPFAAKPTLTHAESRAALRHLEGGDVP